MVWLKAMALVHKAIGSIVVPNMGRVPVKIHGGLESGMVNAKGVVRGFRMMSSLA